LGVSCLTEIYSICLSQKSNLAAQRSSEYQIIPPGNALGIAMHLRWHLYFIWSKKCSGKHAFSFQLLVSFSQKACTCNSLLGKISVIVLVMCGRHIGWWVSPCTVCGSGCAAALISSGVLGLTPSSSSCFFLSQSERLNTHFPSCLMLIFLIEYVSQPLRDWDRGKEAGRDVRIDYVWWCFLTAGPIWAVSLTSVVFWTTLWTFQVKKNRFHGNIELIFGQAALRWFVFWFIGMTLPVTI